MSVPPKAGEAVRLSQAEPPFALAIERKLERQARLHLPLYEAGL